MQSDPSDVPEPTLWRRVRPWIVGLVFFVVAAGLTISLWPSPYRSESVTVELRGAMRGSDYVLGDQGTVTSTTGANYKGRGFSETTLDIPIRWVADRQARVTPALTATLETATGDLMTCRYPRGLPWTGDDVGTVQLRCSRFVSFSRLHDVTDATIAP